MDPTATSVARSAEDPALRATSLYPCPGLPLSRVTDEDHNGDEGEKRYYRTMDPVDVASSTSRDGTEAHARCNRGKDFNGQRWSNAACGDNMNDG